MNERDDCSCVCHLSDDESPEVPMWLDCYDPADEWHGKGWCCECWTLRPTDDEQDDSPTAYAVIEAIVHTLNGAHPAECGMCTYWLGGDWQDCPVHGQHRVVIEHGSTWDPDPWSTDQLDCGCEVLDTGGEGPHRLGVWSNTRYRAAELERLPHPEGHLAGIDFPCNDCGARWQPSAIEDGAHVIVHRPGCTYFEPDLDLNEHVVGRQGGHVTVKLLACVLCWIAALLLVVYVPLMHGRIERARACRHAVVELPQLKGLDYRDGRWWRPDGKLIAFAPTEDSTAYRLGECEGVGR